MTLFHKTKKQRERLGFTDQPGISELDAVDFIKFTSLFQKSIGNIIESYKDKDIALLSKSIAMMVFELHHMAAEIGLPFDEILYEVHKELVSERAASIYGVRIDGVYYPRNNSEGVISTLIANRRASYRTTFRELNLPKLLDFYDTGNAEHRNLSNSVNALMGEELAANLLKKYFEEKGYEIRLSQPCTQGTRQGVRLDYWIEVKKENRSVFYQTEIKNWSSHSLDGCPFPDSDVEQELQNYRRERWLRYFDPQNLVFREANVGKVLTPMAVTNEMMGDIKPLLIVWESVHPSGDSEEFFTVPVQSNAFENISVFSMSTYIRNLINQGRLTLEVDLATTVKKLRCVNEIYETITLTK